MAKQVRVTLPEATRIALQVRLPPKLWNKLTASAKLNRRSLNSEILFRLERSMECGHAHN